MALTYPGTGYLIGSSVNASVGFTNASNALVRDDSVTTATIQSSGGSTSDFTYSSPASIWRLPNNFSTVVFSGSIIIAGEIRVRASFTGFPDDDIFVFGLFEYRNTSNVILETPVSFETISPTLTTYTLPVILFSSNIDYSSLSDIKLKIYFGSSVIESTVDCNLAWADLSLVVQRLNFSTTLTGQGSN